MSETNIQTRMQATLAKSGIPYKEIKCYGSQIMITTWGRESANRYASLLAKFSKVNAVKESIDYNQVNENSALRPTTHKVWRVWATI